MGRTEARTAQPPIDRAASFISYTSWNRILVQRRRLETPDRCFSTPTSTQKDCTGDAAAAVRLPKRAAGCAHASRMGSCTNIQLTRLSGPHIGRQRPLCATVTREDPDTHLPSEYDGFEAISLCAQQTSISDQLMPGSGGTEASHPRNTPNFHEIAGFSRSNAKARSILHSHKDACTCQTCATAGMPQDSCKTQAASSHSRRNSQYSRRVLRPVARDALGYRPPWLLTCGIRYPLAVSAH